jgi:hypothetical protein
VVHSAAARRLLVVCECSGRVRDAFAAMGWDSWSCDLKPSEVGGQHLQVDALSALLADDWGLVVAHPPCTYLAAVGSRYWQEHRLEQDAALAFVLDIWNLAPARCAIENPAGALSRRWRPPDQYVSPHYFGSFARKRTGLWLRGLPPLLSTYVADQPRSFVTREDGSSTRGKANRSRTDRWLAAAMAAQWG